jgi:hypothetical protein
MLPSLFITLYTIYQKKEIEKALGLPKSASNG